MLASMTAYSSKPAILVGRDTRISGSMLHGALCAGVLSVGVDVIDIGVATTPAIAWLAKNMDVQAGVAITASHNPVEYNGIKYIGHNGYKLSDELESEIEAEMHRLPEATSRPTGRKIGQLRHRPQLLQLYIEHLADIPSDDLRGMNIVIDCANGAASAIADWPFVKLGASVRLIHHEPDGLNINENCGSTHLESLQEAVLSGGCDLGLALDGDADRCLAIDATGAEVNGDAMMAILALALRDEGRLPHHTLVTTVMSNYGLYLALEQHGIQSLQTKVGDRYVLEAMKEHGYALGGEQSGHIIFAEHATMGDGLLTGLLLASQVRKSGKSLRELAAVMSHTPQKLINVTLEEPAKAMDCPQLQEAMRQAQAELKGRGRILVRPSGTEPLLRVMVEAPTVEEAQAIAEHLAGIARREG